MTGMAAAKAATAPVHTKKAKSYETIYGKDNEKAKKFLSVGEISRDEKIDLVEHASWSVIAQILLNMDETLTRG